MPRFKSTSAGHPLVPSDPGYDMTFTDQRQLDFNPQQYGAYVDLNYTATILPRSERNEARIRMDYIRIRFRQLFCWRRTTGVATEIADLWAGQLTNGFATYDTWSQGYEYYNSAWRLARITFVQRL